MICNWITVDNKDSVFCILYSITKAYIADIISCCKLARVSFYHVFNGKTTPKQDIGINPPYELVQIKMTGAFNHRRD